MLSLSAFFGINLFFENLSPCVDDSNKLVDAYSLLPQQHDQKGITSFPKVQAEAASQTPPGQSPALALINHWDSGWPGRGHEPDSGVKRKEKLVLRMWK